MRNVEHELQITSDVALQPQNSALAKMKEARFFRHQLDDFEEKLALYSEMVIRLEASNIGVAIPIRHKDVQTQKAFHLSHTHAIAAGNSLGCVYKKLTTETKESS